MKLHFVLSALVLLVLLFLAVPVWANQPAGPVTIETKISFAEFPFSGTFKVTEGKGLLGCSAGTFVDHPSGVEPPAKGDIAKIFTCKRGGSGTFTANFQPTLKPGPGDANGQWSITEATGDFTGLHGGGDFYVIYTGPDSGEEALIGDIHYEP